LDCGPTGYQDYYPALYGGVLALLPHPERVEVEQLCSEELVKTLKNHLTLVYSNQSRFSGMNNWDVYKDFFDRDQNVRKGLQAIAFLSMSAYRKIKAKDFKNLPPLIAEEGALRQKLFAKIVTPPMQELFNELKNDLPTFLGMKVCGAGGGGCFLLVHGNSNKDKEAVERAVLSHGMKKLNWDIQNPLKI
jgi:D-glycero-alpha-D-manno-heptose-7-phosphate kinase